MLEYSCLANTRQESHLERQLFDWQGWDSIDEGAYHFYDCLLKVDIGEHKAGSTVRGIVVDYQRGYLQIDGVAYSLKLQLGPVIDRVPS